MQVIPHYSGEDMFPLVVEVGIGQFRLALEYATFGYRPRGVGLLDVQGIIKARVRLIRPGRSPWERVYEVPIPPDRLPVVPFIQEGWGSGWARPPIFVRKNYLGNSGGVEPAPGTPSSMADPLMRASHTLLATREDSGPPSRFNNCAVDPAKRFQHKANLTFFTIMVTYLKIMKKDT